MSVGDSMTAAVQAPIEKTFTKLLQTKLGKNYFVMNNGVPGYNPSQYYVLLEHNINKYQPEIILLNFFVGNDFISPEQDFRRNPCIVTVVDGYEVSTQYKNKGILFKIRLLFARYSQFYNFLTRLINQNFLVEQKLYEIGITVSPPYREDLLAYEQDSARSNKIYTTTFDVLKDINKLAKEHNSTLIINIIPAPDNVVQHSWNRTTQIFHLNQSIHFNYAYEKLTNFLKKQNIPYLNLLESFKTNPAKIYLERDGHLTEKGHEIVAENIHGFLMQQILLMNSTTRHPKIFKNPPSRK